MTPKEWAAICSDLNGSFAGGFPPDRAESFWRRFASSMSATEFTAVMDRIVERSNFAPTPAEFKAEWDRQAGAAALPWTDVWPVVEQAAHKCGRANANRRVLEWAASQGVDTTGLVARDIATDEPGNTPGAALAAAVVAARLGPVAAVWFATYGRSAILSPSASFGDEQYGTRAIRVLGESYTEYVESRPTREARAALPRRARPELGA